MKTPKTASIIGLTFGSIFLVFNVYMLLTPNPIFVDNDLPSLIIGFGTTITSIYLFITLKKVLNSVFNDTSTDNLLFWIIRLEIVGGIVSLYLLFYSIYFYLTGFANLIQNPTNLIDGVSGILFKVIILLGITIFLSINFALLGNKLRKQRKDIILVLFGILLIIYGITDLLSTFEILSNSFIAPSINCMMFIIMGILFKKYTNSDLSISNIQTIEPLYEDQLEPDLSNEDSLIVENEIEQTNDSSIKEDVKEEEIIINKEDHSRFMPK